MPLAAEQGVLLLVRRQESDPWRVLSLSLLDRGPMNWTRWLADPIREASQAAAPNLGAPTGGAGHTLDVADDPTLAVAANTLAAAAPMHAAPNLAVAGPILAELADAGPILADPTSQASGRLAPGVLRVEPMVAQSARHSQDRPAVLRSHGWQSLSVPHSRVTACRPGRGRRR